MSTKSDPVYDKIEEYESILKEKKAIAQTLRDKKIKGEAKVEQLKKNEKEFIDKIKASGLDPDNLKTYIIERQKKVALIIDKLNNLFPDENGNIKLPSGIEASVNELDSVDVVSGSFDVPKDVDLNISEDIIETSDEDIFSSLEDLSDMSEEDTPF